MSKLQFEQITQKNCLSFGLHVRCCFLFVLTIVAQVQKIENANNTREQIPKYTRPKSLFLETAKMQWNHIATTFKKQVKAIIQLFTYLKKRPLIQLPR